MNLDEDIYLGYHKQIPKYKYDSDSEEEEEFPTKIGGNPIWLNKEQIQKPVCQNCNQKMEFLMQIYSPFNKDHAYHRCLFIFFCKDLNCSKAKQSIRVIKNQLDKDKAIKEYIQSETEQSPFLQKEYKIINDTLEKEEQQHIFLRIEEKINSFNVPDSNFYHKPETAQQKEQKYEKENKLLEQFTYNVLKSENEEMKVIDTEGKLDESDGDEAPDDIKYFIYKEFLSELKNPIILYCNDSKSQPLWCCDDGIWPTNKVEKCQNCGKQRTFEFQINSVLLNLYPEFLEFPWGIITIYSCPDSCIGSNEEICMIQNMEGDQKFNLELLKDKKYIDEQKNLQQIQMLNIQEDEIKNQLVVNEEVKQEDLGDIEDNNKNKPKNKKKNKSKKQKQKQQNQEQNHQTQKNKDNENLDKNDPQEDQEDDW